MGIISIRETSKQGHHGTCVHPRISRAQPPLGTAKVIRELKGNCDCADNQCNSSATLLCRSAAEAPEAYGYTLQQVWARRPGMMFLPDVWLDAYVTAWPGTWLDSILPPTQKSVGHPALCYELGEMKKVGMCSDDQLSRSVVACESSFERWHDSSIGALLTARCVYLHVGRARCVRSRVGYSCPVWERLQRRERIPLLPVQGTAR